jgi:cytochrome c oxidase cbb3-type subunit 3
MSANPTHDTESQGSSGGYYHDRLTTHNYDGIQEYDNPMPLWWKAIFAATVVWAGVYVVAIELGYINKYEENLANEMEIAAAADAARLAALPPLDEKAILEAIGDPEMAAQGEAVFTARCAACHGQQGEGLIGPNLTDNYWLYTGDSMSIYESVANGRPNGMPAWGNILSRDDNLAVSAYVEKMRGTNVKGPKGQEGELFTLDGEAAEEKAEEVEELEEGATDPAEDAADNARGAVEEVTEDVAEEAADEAAADAREDVQE